jgi:hypothetical protein
MDYIYLPVSLGEAIDKLTILDIKIDKIKDHRKIDVQTEYDLLYEKLKEFIIKYNDLYQSMKKVNLLIWDMMDILRDGDNVSGEEYLKICKECVEYNDIRFRVKNKINFLSNSSLKEQKSYKVTRLLININIENENCANFIRPIKYYSFFYDEIIIIYKEPIECLKYDPTIIFKNELNDSLEFKKQFHFDKQLYSKDEILTIFELDNTLMNKIL